MPSPNSSTKRWRSVSAPALLLSMAFGWNRELHQDRASRVSSPLFAAAVTGAARFRILHLAEPPAHAMAMPLAYPLGASPRSDQMRFGTSDTPTVAMIRSVNVGVTSAIDNGVSAPGAGRHTGSVRRLRACGI